MCLGFCNLKLFYNLLYDAISFCFRSQHDQVGGKLAYKPEDQGSKTVISIAIKCQEPALKSFISLVTKS